jgi:hypothetical protein
MKLYANRLRMLAFLSNMSLSVVTSGPFIMIPIVDVNNVLSALNNGKYS